MTNNTTELVPAKTIEARWGVTPDELHRAANKGQITEYRLGSRTLRYNPDEVLTRLVYNTTEPADTPALPANPPAAPTIARPGLTTDDFDQLTYQDWLTLRDEWLRLATGPHIINPNDNPDPALLYLQEVGLNTNNWPGDQPRGTYTASSIAVAKKLGLQGSVKNLGGRVVNIRNKAIRNGYLTVVAPASGRRAATVALSFDFMTTSVEPVGGDGPDIDPSQNQTSPRDRLARIIADLTELHNQLPN